MRLKSAPGGLVTLNSKTRKVGESAFAQIRPEGYDLADECLLRRIDGAKLFHKKASDHQ